MRRRLIELWREALAQHTDPVLAWDAIQNDPQKAQSYRKARGKGGFIRSNWKELNQLIAAANVWTIKNYGPDRVAGFSPSRPCRWSLMPPVRAISPCSAAPA